MAISIKENIEMELFSSEEQCVVTLTQEEDEEKKGLYQVCTVHCINAHHTQVSALHWCSSLKKCEISSTFNMESKSTTLMQRWNESINAF